MLREASFLAATWREADADAAEPGRVDEVLAAPELGRYLEGWPRPGDFGVIAETDGLPVGAAWYRTFTAESHGYGFIDPAIPEISLAVRRSHRRRGVGTELLLALLQHARTAGVGALSLSVEPDNPALLLYRRLGFEPVETVGGALTMRAEIASSAR
jgi:ribosomal protein S18 acetylase RimI-like enzyme